MSPNEHIIAFLRRVCSHLPCSLFRRRVRRELTDHILSRAAYLQSERGYTEAEAVLQALAALGNPDELGKALRKSHFSGKYFCWLLFSLVLWVCIAGCIGYLLYCLTK